MFQPFRVELASLAPDGRRAAFVIREGRGLEVHVFDLDQPAVKKRVPLDARAAAQPTFLAWVGADRVVAATDQPLIVSIEADTAVVRALLDAKALGAPAAARRAVRVLGLVSGDPDGLMVETTSMPAPREVLLEVLLEVLRINVRTGERRGVDTVELDFPGGAVLVDRQGRARVLWPRDVLLQRFGYRAVAAGGSRWRALDRVAGETPALAFHVTPQNYLGERSVPLGFDEDPEILYFASNVGRDTFGVYALDLRAGRRTDFAVEDAECDLVDLHAPWQESPLIFDRARRALVGVRRNKLEAGTRWLDPEIAGVQAALAKKFPGRTVQLLDWDDARERFLALIASDADPGRYFVFHRASGQCVEHLRRAPAIAPEMINRAEPFACDTAGDRRISGYVTVPHSPRVAEPPLLVWLHDGPGRRVAPGFNREAQALAAQGFMVAQLNYRGSAGFGRAAREAARADPDAGVADVLAAVAWLAPRHRFDRRRVALVGEGFGGYLALRALQRHPEAFRAAVSINAPMELGDLRRSLPADERNRRAIEQEMIRRVMSPRPRASNLEEQDAESAATTGQMMALMEVPPEPVDFEHEFLRAYYGGVAELGKFSVLREPGRITRPVMLLHEAAHRYAPVAAVRELRDALERRKLPVAYGEIPAQFARGVPQARAQVLRRVGEFLNVTLYDFDVKVGEARETK